MYIGYTQFTHLHVFNISGTREVMCGRWRIIYPGVITIGIAIFLFTATLTVGPK